MKKYIDECVDCGASPCLGRSCPYRHIEVDYCDECGAEETAYIINGKSFCERCAAKEFKRQFDRMPMLVQLSCLSGILSIADMDELWQKLEVEDMAAALETEMSIRYM